MERESDTCSVLEMFVLDVLQHDVAEQLPSIIRMLNNRGCIGWRDFWPNDFSPEEVATALRQLSHRGFVEVFCQDHAGEFVLCGDPNWSGPYDSLWFGMSSTGKENWEHWDPPPSPMSN